MENVMIDIFKASHMLSQKVVKVWKFSTFLVFVNVILSTNVAVGISIPLLAVQNCWLWLKNVKFTLKIWQMKSENKINCKTGDGCHLLITSTLFNDLKCNLRLELLSLSIPYLYPIKFFYKVIKLFKNHKKFIKIKI